MSKPFIVGLTGGIASGKSAASKHFESLGISVVDADIIAREVVEPHTLAFSMIKDRFGDCVLSPSGELDRGALRSEIFAHNSHKQWLNKLLHPLIREQMYLQTQNASGPYVVLAVPLLIENKLNAMVDRVLVIDCDHDTQVSRALGRDGSKKQTILNIIDSQASREERAELADDIILNNKDLSTLWGQIEVMHKNYLTLADKNM